MSHARTYLDWNASAPLLPQARAAMLAALDHAGNASSVHAEGRAARRIVEGARECIAALAGAKPGDVVLTSGATEANATVLAAGWDTFICAGIEHDSVLAPILRSGVPRIALPVTGEGQVDVAVAADLIEKSAGAGRVLLTLQLANNETGAIQPLSELGEVARAHGVAVHTDATQAMGRLPVDAGALGVDYLTFSSHKLGGPKGAGALIARAGAHFEPLIAGGGQEQRRRAGTENVAAVAGFGAACDVALADLAAAVPARIGALRDDLERMLAATAPQTVVLCSDVSRIVSTALIAMPGQRAETLVAALDLEGFAVSAGAACSSGKVAASHVLAAMGVNAEIAHGAVRVSLGPTTTENDVAAFAAAWARVTSRVRQAA